MNTKRRMAQLEAKLGTETSIESYKLLVELLGRTDAIFWPWREKGSYRAEIARLQKEYLAGSGYIRLAGQGRANWKSQHKLRNELVGSGLAVAQLSGGQVSGLRLTAQGLADAMALVGDRLHQVSHSIKLLEMLKELGGFCNESTLFGVQLLGNPQDWEVLTDVALPLLRSGLISANSDAGSRVYFALENAEIPTEPTSMLKEVDWADQWYIDCYESERAALMRLDCTAGVWIPVPTGL